MATFKSILRQSLHNKPSYYKKQLSYQTNGSYFPFCHNTKYYGLLHFLLSQVLLPLFFHECFGITFALNYQVLKIIIFLMGLQLLYFKQHGLKKLRQVCSFQVLLLSFPLMNNFLYLLLKLIIDFREHHESINHFVFYLLRFLLALVSLSMVYSKLEFCLISIMSK